jgi:hypothetical protein
MKTLLIWFASVSFALAQLAVHDAPLQVTTQLQHAEEIAKWTEQISKATEQIQKLNQMVDQLNDVQGLIGKGMEAVGIPSETVNAIELGKAVNNFGEAMADLQHSASAVNLDRMRQKVSDPDTWERHLLLSKSYEQTQRSQRDFDSEIRQLNRERAKAQAQLRSASSLGETAKAQTTLDEINAAEEALDRERRRAFEQQQANFIESQNQKEAWEQAGRDWTATEMKNLGKSINQYLKPEGAAEK